jgi:hypothetical protein
MPGSLKSLEIWDSLPFSLAHCSDMRKGNSHWESSRQRVTRGDSP